MTQHGYASNTPATEMSPIQGSAALGIQDPGLTRTGLSNLAPCGAERPISRLTSQFANLGIGLFDVLPDAEFHFGGDRIGLFHQEKVPQRSVYRSSDYRLTRNRDKTGRWSETSVSIT